MYPQTAIYSSPHPDLRSLPLPGRGGRRPGWGIPDKKNRTPALWIDWEASGNASNCHAKPTQNPPPTPQFLQNSNILPSHNGLISLYLKRTLSPKASSIKNNAYICTRNRHESCRAMRKSICISPTFKVRQNFNQRTAILMPLASAYVLALCHCILEHGIRFKVGFILERCLAIPKSRRTNNSSSMLF